MSGAGVLTAHPWVPQTPVVSSVPLGKARIELSSTLPPVLSGLVFASMGWGQESPPCTGTGTPSCRHHAWPHIPGKPVGRRKRGSGQAGGSGIALVGLEGPVPSQSTPPHCLSCPRGRAGCAGNPHCSESVRCTSLSRNTAQNPLRCCTSHQHPRSPVPARQGTPGCFPCPPRAGRCLCCVFWQLSELDPG